MKAIGDLRLSELRERVRQLARLLDIPADTYAGREREAALIMAHLTMMPTVRDHDKRRAYGNEILANADALLPSTDLANAGFWSKLREVVITMQELPAWYLHFSKSNEELIRDYWWLDRALGVMQFIGLSGVTGSGGSGIRSGFRSFSSNRGRDFSARLGAIVRDGVKGAANTATGGFKGEAAVVWVVGALAYQSGVKNRDALRRELTRRYQEKRLSETEYFSVFGNSEPLPRQFLYRLR